MRKTLYLLILICFATEAIKAQNINLSNSAYWDGECSLAVNPKNPKHLVSAWIYFSLTNLKNTIATRSSFDGGKTWTPIQTMPHLYPKFTCADPSLVFGKDTCIYLAYIDLSGVHSSDSGYDMVARSVNSGVTWNTPVKAIGWNDQPNLPIDRPWIGTDASNGPYSGRVYLTSQNAYFAPGTHHPWFTYSTDSGATWTPIKQIDDSIPAGVITDAVAFNTVAANGTLYAVYYSYYVTYSVYPRLIMLKSYDGGNSFTTHAAVNFTASDVIPAADSLLKDGICISANPADTNNLIIVGTSNHFGEPDIVSYNTHNAGQTWNGPIRLNDDVSGAYDTCHDLTWGGFANNGMYAAVWRDRRNLGKGDSSSFKIYGTTSSNGGDSYNSNFVISDTISPPVYVVRGDDFLGCAVTDSNVYALWSDMRTGKENTFFNADSFSKILSVASISDNSEVKVDAYPNPFHNSVNIAIHTPKSITNGKLFIYSIDGRQVAELPVTSNSVQTLNLSALTSGTYIWSLTQNGNKLAQGKWLVQ